MIYLKLFLTFLEIGTVSFGGGYGMIALVREAVLGNGWLTEEEFLNLIAVSESTPGPIAVNTATFVGSTQGGFFGAGRGAALFCHYSGDRGADPQFSSVCRGAGVPVRGAALRGGDDFGHCRYHGPEIAGAVPTLGRPLYAGLEKSGNFRPALGGASLLEENAEKSAVTHGNDRAFGAGGDFVFRAGVRGFFTVSADQWLPAGSGRKKRPGPDCFPR